VMMAGDYFYNHNLSYGPSYLGWASSNRKWWFFHSSGCLGY
jgi:hypothetical protein